MQSKKAHSRTTSHQLPLPLRAPHGGRRKGAGRKNRSGRQGHGPRERLGSGIPLHVTLKLAPGLPSLRRKDVFRILREAVRTARKQGFAVAHFAVLSTHVHLLIEPEKRGISKPIQSLCISFAKRLNHRLKRSGAIFHDRYHTHALRTPMEVRNALSYVLANEARHASRDRPRGRMEVRLDPFSSALAFRHWRALMGRSVVFLPSSWSDSAIEAWHSELLRPPTTWLLQSGWKPR